MQNSASESRNAPGIWLLAFGLFITGLVCFVARAQMDLPETSWLALILGIFIWAGAGALCALLVKWLSWFHGLWLALAAVWRPLAIVLVGAGLLFLTDQGRELGLSLMIDSADRFDSAEGVHLAVLFVMLFLALIYWSLNSWHSARLGVRAALDQGLIGVTPTYPLPERPGAHVVGTDEQWLFWLPRTLGVCAHFFAAFNLAFAAWNQRDFVDQPTLIRLLAWTAPFAVAAFTVLVYIFDRYWLSERTHGERSALFSFASLVVAAALLFGMTILSFVNFRAASTVWAGFLCGTLTISLSAFAFLLLVSFLRRNAPLGVDTPEDARRQDDQIEDESLARWTFGLFWPAFAVFVLVWFWAPFVGRTLGSMVVAYFALGAVLATVNALEHAIARLIERGFFGDNANPRTVGGYIAATLVALGVVNAWLHPFHPVRRCDEAGGCVAPALAAAYVHDPDKRPSVEEAAEAWYAQAKAAFLRAHAGRMDENDRVPMVVVATAGGGIRAAYWTATILEQLKEDLGPNGLRPYLFAISGVSGGSVGATVFDAALANSDESGCSETCPRATEFLTEDFLAPTLASGIFKDLPSSLLPDLWQDDRGAALEQGFEHASGGRLSRPFLSLFPYGGKPSQAWRPILLLNATHEETGKRIITSHVLIERNNFIDALDALHVLDHDVRASTAAHNSARFSYVSPAGNLGRRKDATVANGLISRFKAWLAQWNGSVIDGGYFENFGALSALELARDAKAALDKDKAPVKLVVLLISSDPDLGRAHPLVRIEEPDGKACVVSSTERENGTPPPFPNYLSVDKGQVANAWLNELVAPLQGVQTAREAHGNRAAAELAVEVCSEFIAHGQQPPPATAPGTNAPPPAIRPSSTQMQAAVTASQGKTVQVTDKALPAKPDEPYFAHLAMCRADDSKDVIVQPPLGWVLSAQTRRGLDDLVRRCGNREQLSELEKALGRPQPQAKY
jgi:hypothetical protein